MVEVYHIESPINGTFVGSDHLDLPSPVSVAQACRPGGDATRWGNASLYTREAFGLERAAMLFYQEKFCL